MCSPSHRHTEGIILPVTCTERDCRSCMNGLERTMQRADSWDPGIRSANASFTWNRTGLNRPVAYFTFHNVWYEISIRPLKAVCLSSSKCKSATILFVDFSNNSNYEFQYCPTIRYWKPQKKKKWSHPQNQWYELLTCYGDVSSRGNVTYIGNRRWSCLRFTKLINTQQTNFLLRNI
jgi:hypothetical protein